MRKILTTLILAITLSTTIPTVLNAAEPEIKVYIEGQQVSFDVAPVIVDGTTLVQFRPVFEKLGLKISWDPKYKRIQGTRGDQIIVDMMLGNKSVTANNKAITLDVAPNLMGDYTMVPLRFLGEASGKTVKWNSDSRTITINKGYEKDVITNPVGGDSFITLVDLNDNQNVQPHIYEKDGYVYTTWTNDFTNSTIQSTRFLASIAKDNKWIKQNEQVYWQRKDQGVTYQSFYADGSYFLKYDKSINKITPRADGSVNISTVAYNVYMNTGATETMKPIYVDGQAAVLYKQSYTISYGTTAVPIVMTQIYYNNNGNSDTVPVNDYHNLLNALPSNTQLYYSTDKKLLYLIDDFSYRQLDVSSGDIKYGTDGKDLVTNFVNDARAGSTQRYIQNGTMYNLYFDTNGDTYKLYTVDKNMVVNEPIITQLKQQNLYNKDITFTSNSIHLWSRYEFNRRPAIQLDSYTKYSK